MRALSISEVAIRSGTPVSTLRYYERIGLVRPERRGANNYRHYDPSVVERLAFIAEAKSLGLSLAEVAGLVDAWAAGDCGPLAAGLRACLSDLVTRLRRRIEADQRTERRVRAILRGAGVSAAKCHPGCGCELHRVDDRAGLPCSCSLDQGELGSRLAEWGRLLARATEVERATDWLRAEFADGASISELSRLCAAEVACCPFLEFHLDIVAGNLVLTISGPLPSAAVSVVRAS